MRLIDADALKEKFQECINSITVSDPFITGVKNGYESAGYWIDEAPTVEERKHGHWIEHPEHPICDCSVCGERVPIYSGSKKYKICPYCGAKMEGE
jgi:hypothetical protein